MDVKNIVQGIFKTGSAKVVEWVIVGIIAGYYGNKVFQGTIGDLENKLKTEIKVQNKEIKDSLSLNSKEFRQLNQNVIKGQVAFSKALKNHILKTTQDKNEIINIIETLAPYSINEKKKLNQIQYCLMP